MIGVKVNVWGEGYPVITSQQEKPEACNISETGKETKNSNKQ